MLDELQARASALATHGPHARMEGRCGRSMHTGLLTRARIRMEGLQTTNRVSVGHLTHWYPKKNGSLSKKGHELADGRARRRNN